MFLKYTTLTTSISPTCTLVTISEVQIPGAIATMHNQQALNSFGDTPFSLVCLQSHLRSYNPITSISGASTMTSSLSDSSGNIAAPQLLPTTIRDVDDDPESSEGTGNLLASMDSATQESGVADSASGTR